MYPFLGVLLNPIVAGGAMALSSITVVSNANRLLRFTPKTHRRRLITSQTSVTSKP
ncbi:hypothetical protein PCI56_09585 [Plesiomonas shigelloides subsp. oncorhynchi]|nr:hypothetical protein [Plesiomonas shigelloides]